MNILSVGLIGEKDILCEEVLEIWKSKVGGFLVLF